MVCLVPLFIDYELTNFLKIVSLCNVCLRTNAFLPSAICICWNTHCPMTGWVCQWKPFWLPVDDSFKKAFVEEWNSKLQIRLIFHFPEVKGMQFLRLLRYQCLFLHPHGDLGMTRTLLVLEKELRHHCSHYSHDLLVNVWNCPSPVMQFCLVTRISSHQVWTTLLCGER